VLELIVVDVGGRNKQKVDRDPPVVPNPALRTRAVGDLEFRLPVGRALFQSTSLGGGGG
jgi:hypothetical protein